MLDEQMPAAGDDPAAGAPVQAETIDPMAALQAHVEAGTAAPERVRTETTPDVEALVREWWDRTRETAEFTKAADRTSRDLLAINGGTPAEIADAAEVTVNHIYRNAIQTVAMTVPELQSVEFRPREQVEPLPGMQVPPEYQQERQRRMGLAAVLGVLFRRFGDDANLQDIAESYVRNATHFRASIVKTWFQASLEDDPVGETRLPDEQDLLARARVLVEQFNAGDFSEQDAKFAQLKAAMAAIGKTELAIRRGIVVEQVPLTQYRCDPAVTAPEHIGTAAWEAQDILMRRDEILAKWAEISPDDLVTCSTWTLDDIGRAVKREREERTSTARDISVAIGGASPSAVRDDDWLLCREIYDYRQNTRFVLIEGLLFPAVEVPILRGPTGMSPFEVLVLNPRPWEFYGFSDTELQAKLQDAINRLQTAEEDGRQNAQPRWGYDPAVITDEKSRKAILAARPWELVPIITAKGNLKDALVPLVGNHEYNEREYDPSRLEERMRAMAMLPEQALGVTGAAHFAAEVDVAASGANAMARYRQTRIIRSLKRLYHKIAQLILFNVPKELATKYAGPMAMVFYPDEPADRALVYDGLDIAIDVKLDQQLDYARRADSLVKLLDVLVKIGMKPNGGYAAKLMGKFLGMEDEATDLFEPNPNDLVGQLAQSLQTNPGSMTPEALAMLAQLGQAAQQQVAQIIAQQIQQNAAAGAAQGRPMPPGAGGPGGAPPRPMPPAAGALSTSAPPSPLHPQPVG